MQHTLISYGPSVPQFLSRGRRSLARSLPYVRPAWLAAAVLGLTLGANTYETGHIYTMIDIPGAACVGAFGVNDYRQVVLYDCSGPQGIPYLWQDGTLAQLPQDLNVSDLVALGCGRCRS